MELYLAVGKEHCVPVPQGVHLSPVWDANEGRGAAVPAARPSSGDVLMFCPDSPSFSCRETAAERIADVCLQGGFSGLAADLPPPPTSEYAGLAAALDRVCAARRLHLWVPELYAPYTRYATILICTALSGGTLHHRLAEAVVQYGAKRLALDCQRLAVDLFIPSPNGEGRPLSLLDLANARQGRAVFFSDGLCARYFTYCAGNRHHFVLFDDAQTLQGKLSLGAKLGISSAFFVWHEVADIAEELFLPTA